MVRWSALGWRGHAGAALAARTTRGMRCALAWKAFGRVLAPLLAVVGLWRCRASPLVNGTERQPAAVALPLFGSLAVIRIGSTCCGACLRAMAASSAPAMLAFEKIFALVSGWRGAVHHRHVADVFHYLDSTRNCRWASHQVSLPTSCRPPCRWCHC
jgi:hypothetical protein